jgi:peptidoglycan/LPS O-acetylase OafA/YrhL
MVSVGGGFIGVDLFFVLSGFLVSHVIFSEVDERGTFSLGGFYSRRVRRLLPAAVVVIVVTSFVQILVGSQTQRLSQIADARAALIYLANWQFIADSRDYFAAGTAESPFLHFWSLSIEEQFYIAFPLLLLLVFRFAARPMRLLAGIMSGILLVSLVLQFWHAQSDPTYAYYATETRLYQLAAGVVLALAVRARRPSTATRRATVRPDYRRRVPSTIALAGFLGILVLASGIIDISPSLRGVLATGAAVAAIGGLYADPRTPLARVLSMPWPRYLGQISYGTYLWHWPVLLMLRQLFDVRPVVMAVLAAAVATGLASLSAQLLETPIRRVRLPESYRWPVVSAGLTVSLLAAAFLVPNLLESERRPAISAGSESGTMALAEAAGVERLNRPVPASIDLQAALEDIPRRVPLCTTQDVDACELVPGDGPHVLLTGDSHAQMFQGAFASLARDHGFRLSASVFKGCPWQEGLRNVSTSADPEYCRQAREELYHDVLPQMNVDIVVAISMSRSDKMWEKRLQAVGDAPEGEDLLQRQYRTAQETSEVFRAAGADLIIVKSVMGTAGYDRAGWDPLDCLARAKTLGACAVVPPMSRPALDGLYDAIATTTPDVATVDLNPILCPDAPLCAPVVDGTVVWKDPDHVTHTYLNDHRDAIYRRLRETGLFG